MINLPEDYKQRPMAPELDLPSRIHGRFKGTGLVMPLSQRNIYEGIVDMMREEIKAWRGYPKQIRKPTVADVGCGCGIGTNILSREASFSWGIDTNEESINYAKQMFERNHNNVYYTPQVTFDVIDVTDEPRGIGEFDYVTCIEVIEHIPAAEADTLMTFLKRLVKKTKAGEPLEGPERTKVFLTTPNRSSPKIQDDTPRNEHHCYEPTAGEMYEYLTKHWKAVTVLNEDMEPQELDTEATPLVYKLEMPA